MQRYTMRYTDKEGRQMELKASFYIKACKRVREMLRVYPEVKQSLTIAERQKMAVDLARYLQRMHEEKLEEEELNQRIHTKREYCRHCIYGQYLIGKQVVCEATNRLVSDNHRGMCVNYKEGYTRYSY